MKLTPLLSSAMVLSLLASSALAQVPDEGKESFRVTIRMFDQSGRRSVEVAEHLVLFDSGMVYAVPAGGEEDTVTIIDESRRRLVLIHREKEVKTTIATEDLVELTARLRANATQPEQRARLGIGAQVKTDVSGVHSISYGDITYKTTVQEPTNPRVAADFGNFANWATRLNIARARGLPPIGRMLLTDHLAKLNQLPLETTLMFGRGPAKREYRSTHSLVQRISQADRKLIDELGSMLALYTEVPLREFPNE